MIRLKISEQPYSKANSRKLVLVSNGRGGKRPLFIKSEKARNFEQGALIELKRQKRELGLKMLDEPLVISCWVYYRDRRPDLDCSLVYDVLEKSEIIKNDRLLYEKHEYRFVDKENQRVEIELGLLDRDDV